MKLTSRSRYGARLMLDLACNYGKGPVLLRSISKRLDISLGYLEHLMPPLKTAGLLTSMRGVHGGYVLSKSPDKITLKDVIIAMEGTLSPTKCLDAPSTCSRVDHCVTRDIWNELKSNISNTLESITLEDMVSRQQEKMETFSTYTI